MPSPFEKVVIPYEATEFPAWSGLNGTHDLLVTWDELLCAVITVGKARQHLLESGRYSFAEALHRVTCIEAYYDVDRSRRLISTVAFDRLDPTEKGLVSYYLGMAMSKLFADKVLSTPWLMHISRYAAEWSIVYSQQAARPDLFGWSDDGHWIVAEAKGRARIGQSLLDKMKHQKSTVATIQDIPPRLRYGSATRFKRGQAELVVVDPPGLDDADEVPMNTEAWLEDYYRPLVDILDQTNSVTVDGLVQGDIPGSDVTIGLPTPLVDAVRESRQIERARPHPRPAAPDTLETDLAESRSPRAEGREFIDVVVRESREMQERAGTGDGVVIRSRRRR